MNGTTQQTPLPTMRPGDSHAESLIDAAIQGHASTREAMRWLVRQIVPQPAHATQAEVTLLTNMLESAQKEAQRLQKEVDRMQPRADVTDEQINAAYLAWCKTNGTPESFARAILALRPATVPMTPASRDVIMATRTANADAEEWPEPWAYQRGWNNAEAHHGITAQAKKETP